MSRYSHIVRAIAEQPWALQREKLAVMLDLVAFRVAGGHLTKPEISQRLGVRAFDDDGDESAPKPDKVWLYSLDGDLLMQLLRDQPLAAATSNSQVGTLVAVIGVYGVITQRADMFTDMSGGTSIERLTSRIRSALADPAVKGIVFEHDSPGGGVYGVEELAQEIRDARGQKPIEAISNSLMASASYYLGSQADNISITPSGEAGSIGVYAAHEDISKMLEDEGVRVTLISYGDSKTEGNPFEPLTSEGKAFIEQRVREYGVMFERAVAKGRSYNGRTVSVEDVRANYGQGRVYGAKEAVKRGMADQVATLEDVIRKVGGRSSSSTSAKTPGPVVAEAPDTARAAAAALLGTL